MQAFVPKSRKPKFDLVLSIIDLNNIPLICGSAYVKWHLPSSTAAEHRGRTEKVVIREHKAVWDYSKTINIRMTIDKNQKLQQTDIELDVIQEYHEGSKGRVTLGNVRLNIAEYVDRPELKAMQTDSEREGGDGRVTRRYLMQDSKINSTLKVGIQMKQVEGDTDFEAPPLNAAMGFGGIAGIIATEPGEGDSAGPIPSLTNKTRELAELQDIYRRTLAATWACRAGELPPDKLIEDLFAGGDGGRTNPPQPPLRHWRDSMATANIGRDGSTSSGSEPESKRHSTHQHLTPDAARHPYRTPVRHDSSDNEPRGGRLTHVAADRGSMGHHLLEGEERHHRKHEVRYQPVTEFDVRDDLRSWEISAR